jgi:predicted acyl esterase
MRLSGVKFGASWSDQGLHTRGSIETFERISSTQKWLFTHGRKKWETFYGEEALSWQERFPDHFLRDINGMDRTPRLEVRKACYAQNVRSDESWPPPRR